MQGYVHLLTHPIVPDLVKLESLTVDIHDPLTDRKNIPPDLSSFIVIDTIYVSNYLQAEAQIRQEFENLNVMHSETDDGFKLEIPVAIDILQRYQMQNDAMQYETIFKKAKLSKPTVFLEYQHTSEDILEKDQHIDQKFFQKNGYIRTAAKLLLDQAEIETEDTLKFEMLKKAFQLGSTEAGLKLAVHPQLLGYDNTQARIEHIMQTCQLIQSIPKTDPYYHEFWNHNFPEMIFLLMWALEDADNIEEFALCDALIYEFKSQFSQYLDEVFFPCTQLMLKKLPKSNRMKARKQCINTFNSMFAYQFIANNFPQLNQKEIGHLVEDKLESLHTVYEDLAYWLANLIYGVDFDTDYIKLILGKDYAQKIFLIQQALQLKQHHSNNDNKLEFDRIQACISYLKHHQLYDQLCQDHLKEIALNENSIIEKLVRMLKTIFSYVLKLK